MFPSNPYVATHILALLSNDDVRKLWHANSAIAKVCTEDDLWIMKLEWEFGIVPSDHSEAPMALYQRLHKLPDTRGLPNIISVDDAVNRRDLPAVKCLASFGITADEHAIDKACLDGFIEIVQYFSSCRPPILPSQKGIYWACINGHSHVVKHLTTLTPPILPSQDVIDDVCTAGKTKVIIHLSSLTPPLVPSQRGIDLAYKYGYTKIIKHLASLNPPLLPSDHKKLQSA